MSCAPPQKTSVIALSWINGTLLLYLKRCEKFRFISTENSDGVLDQQYYPDTKDGKTLFESHVFQCTGR